MGPAGGDGFNAKGGLENTSLRLPEVGRHLLCGEVCAEGKAVLDGGVGAGLEALRQAS